MSKVEILSNYLIRSKIKSILAVKTLLITFYTYIVLRSILIPEEYGLVIEYIQVKNTVVEDSLLKLPTNGNQNTTHESNYITETIFEINDTK